MLNPTPTLSIPGHQYSTDLYSTQENGSMDTFDGSHYTETARCHTNSDNIPQYHYPHEYGPGFSS